MNIKNPYTVFGAVLCVLGCALAALCRLKLSLPWPGWVSYTLCGVYICYTALIFCMPRFKGADFFSCIILTVEFAALALIVLSIGLRKTPDSYNWYLPAGLFLSAAGNFANAYRSNKQKKQKAS